MTEPAKPTQRRSPRAIAIMLALLALYTYADLATKEYALDHLSQERTSGRSEVCQVDERDYIQFQRVPTNPQPFAEGFIRLNYAENCGAAFSMLRSAPSWVRSTVFGVTTVGATILLLTMFIRGSGDALFAAAVPLIVGGAIGNFSDRIRHGFVVDFIQIDPTLFRYPVFNVADIWLAIGIGLLVLDSFKRPPGTKDAVS